VGTDGSSIAWSNLTDESLQTLGEIKVVVHTDDVHASMHRLITKEERSTGHEVVSHQRVYKGQRLLTDEEFKTETVGDEPVTVYLDMAQGAVIPKRRSERLSFST
jgi:hypothetical protein